MEYLIAGCFIIIGAAFLIACLCSSSVEYDIESIEYYIDEHDPGYTNEELKSQDSNKSICSDCVNAFDLNYRCADCIRSYSTDNWIRYVVSCTGFDEKD